MPMNRLLVVLVLMSIPALSGHSLAKEAQADPAAAAADSLNQRREAIESEWSKHRSQHIAVLDIDGLKASEHKPLDKRQILRFKNKTKKSKSTS